MLDIYQVENPIDGRFLDERRKDAHTGEKNSTNQSALFNFGSETIFHYGKLQPFLDDESIEEIWINSPNRIFVARKGVSQLAPVIISAQEIRDITERMLAWSGRRVDLSQPFVDARLPNGARLHVVIPDITAEYWALNIRKKVLPAFSLQDLVTAGSVSDAVAEVLEHLVSENINFLVSGATHAGKTTVLNSLLGSLPTGSRLITLEEVFELTPRVADHVALQIRQVNLEGTGEVSLRTLVRESLRMRPSHLVIGEVRGAEALDLLLALNSGIPGMASIHANSANDALRKISTLALLAGPNIVREFALEAVRENIDVVIHCKQSHDGVRRIVDIAVVRKSSINHLTAESLLFWDGRRYLPGEIDFDSVAKLQNVREFLLRKTSSLRMDNDRKHLSEL